MNSGISASLIYFSESKAFWFIQDPGQHTYPKQQCKGFIMRLEGAFAIECEQVSSLIPELQKFQTERMLSARLTRNPWPSFVNVSEISPGLQGR